MVVGAKPSPSVPNTSASFGSAARRASSSGTESSDNAIAAVANPSSCSSGRPPFAQAPLPARGSASSPMRVHGTWNTVPIDTRTARRYNGS